MFKNSNDYCGCWPERHLINFGFIIRIFRTTNVRLLAFCKIWLQSPVYRIWQSSPLAYFAVFSATAWNLNAKLYTLI